MVLAVASVACAGRAARVALSCWPALSPPGPPRNSQQYGLRYDKITLHVEAGKVYSSGRYFVGLGRRVSVHTP